MYSLYILTYTVTQTKQLTSHPNMQKMGHQGQADKVRMREPQKELTVYNCENVKMTIWERFIKSGDVEDVTCLWTVNNSKVSTSWILFIAGIFRT